MLNIGQKVYYEYGLDLVEAEIVQRQKRTEWFLIIPITHYDYVIKFRDVDRERKWIVGERRLIPV
jgi:hypothetical protein